MNIRRVDLTTEIYIGETIQFNFPDNSRVRLLNIDGTKTEYEYPYPVLDTSDWQTGARTAIVDTSNNTVIRTFEVINPMQTATEYNQIMYIIRSIDLVIQSRIEGNAVISQTIQNKSLLMESTDALIRMRGLYVKRANHELKKMKNISGGNPIKSISHFNRRK